ncbi:cation transporter [Synechocystis sp. LEGE 06083]|uniref:cation transporter n=1 Tax=Synechocystis sp. LEGE 06083 TaxID=915336 RepID=UPI00187F3404|nr:cation transporter [Synechocystis sp. LEGE 06083]MBE9196707.1 cation transporter [Synechocystis sp. LEGE 06083]
MVSSSTSLTILEKRSLKIARFGNVIMAIAGILTAWMANADALLVDGLYSGINFLSSLVAARVGESVMRPWDKTRPFGYYADEAIYITFRSVILLGILAFAVFSAITKIIAYASGHEFSEIVLGLIVIYSVGMTVICGGLYYVHRYYWLKTGKRSDILKTEQQSALIDGVISAAVGLAFGLAPLLKNTPLHFILPVIDSVIVLVLVALIINQPIRSFLNALAEIAGESSSPRVIASIHEAVSEAMPEAMDYTLIDVASSKLGRFHVVMIYLNVHHPIQGELVDELRLSIKSACEKRIGLVEVEVILTATPRLLAR